MNDKQQAILDKLTPRTDEEWERFGYPSNEPCCVCGETENVKSEPWFGYTVCQKHGNISPVETNEFRK